MLELWRIARRLLRRIRDVLFACARHVPPCNARLLVEGRNGRVMANGLPCQAMPAFSGELTDGQIDRPSPDLIREPGEAMRAQ